MPRKQTADAAPPKQCFVKELAGETPPTFEAMQTLYRAASQLYGLRPWQTLYEDNLIVVRDSVSSEPCFCSVMGSAGEVFSLHVYLGAEGLRQFRKLEAEQIADPGEFFATTHCLYVEFVAKAELLRQDRDLLACLGHPQGRGLASPIFRAQRPGFLPWFVTADEARTLTACIRAVILFCNAVAAHQRVAFWEQPDTYPLVTLGDGAEPHSAIEMFHLILPPEPPVAAARVEEETLLAIRGRNYAVRGVTELDLTYSAGAIGKKGQRNALAAIAIAVDAESGLVLAPEVGHSSVPAGDTLAKVFLKTIQTSRALPSEVRVRSRRFQQCLAPLMESLGVKVRVAKKLPALDQAMSGLLNYLA